MKKRILFVGGTTGGGVATINNEVIRIFREEGHDCRLVDTEDIVQQQVEEEQAPGQTCRLAIANAAAKWAQPPL